MNRSALSIALLASQTALALPLPGIAPLIGTGAVQGAPEAVCKITQIRDGKPFAICTGSLISPTEVLTAAHCLLNPEGALEALLGKLSGVPIAELPKGASLKIECGYVAAESSRIKREVLGESTHYDGLTFKETFGARSYAASLNYMQRAEIQNDLGTIQLDGTSSIQPMRLLQPTDIATFFATYEGVLIPLQDNLECRVSGFGVSAGGDALGLPYTAPLGDQLLGSADNSFIFGVHGADVQSKELADLIVAQGAVQGALELEKTGKFTSLMLSGDSGGPLICRKDKDSPWTQIGVAARIGHPASAGSSIFGMHFWASLASPVVLKQVSH